MHPQDREQLRNMLDTVPITAFPNPEAPGVIQAYGLSVTAFERVHKEFDVFTRSDVSDEVILDVSGWDDDQLAPLWEVLKQKIEDVPGYFLFYVNH